MFVQHTERLARHIEIILNACCPIFPTSSPHLIPSTLDLSHAGFSLLIEVIFDGCFVIYDSHFPSLTKDISLFIAKYADHLAVQITCDGCGDRLSGRRYRCLNCEDLDLCSKCYSGKKIYFQLNSQ